MNNLEVSTASAPTDSHSRRLVPESTIKALREWRDRFSDDIEKVIPEEDVERLDRELRQAFRQASHLGFPRAAKLAAALNTAFHGIPMEGGVHVRESWCDGLRTLVQLLASPHTTHALQIDTLLSHLAVEMPSEKYNWSALVASAGTTLPQIAMESNAGDELEQAHEDTVIYRNAQLDAMARCTAEESWTVAQIAAAAEDLALSPERVRPAHRLMSVLHNHRFFQEVDRLCLAGLVAGGNQLMVVDSVVSSRVRDLGIGNPMRRGYACFVDPNGSLAKMRPGVLRVFGDSSQVLDSFARQGRPAQRSIAYVADSGMRSGFCLAVGRAETIQGFVFMNSINPDQFAAVTNDYSPLISLIGLLGTIAFDAAGFHGDSIDLPESIPTHSIPYEPQELARQLQAYLLSKTGRERPVRCETLDNTDFLYLPATVVRAAGELINRTTVPQEEAVVKVQVLEAESRVQLAIQPRVPDSGIVPSEWLDRCCRELKHQFQAEALEVALDEGKFLLSFPFEPILDTTKHLPYSVVY
ncbi:hypothetical protein SH139x_004342 [Planctomycetaceae bacterium SH139]